MRDHLLQTDKSGDNVADWLLREPGKHCDGAGLYLEVAAPGQASWMYRYKNRWGSLGSANGFSIREARAKAEKLWQASRRGEDPFALLATMRTPRRKRSQRGGYSRKLSPTTLRRSRRTGQTAIEPVSFAVMSTYLV